MTWQWQVIYYTNYSKQTPGDGLIAAQRLQL